MTVQRAIKQLDPKLVSLIETASLGSKTVGIVPDSLREYDGRPTALFRAESRDLQAVGSQLGIEIELLTPDGAERAILTERADSVILPIVIGLSTQLVANVLTPYVEALIDKWKKSGNRKPDVVYRKGEWKADGSIERVDITGDAESILDILKEESDDANE